MISPIRTFQEKNNYGKFTHGPPSARRLAVLTMPCQELFCSPRDLLRIHDGTTDHTADVPGDVNETAVVPLSQ